MKNITLSADEKLIEAARERARAEHTTLNEQFRLWLEDYARRGRKADEAMALVERMRGYVRTGGRKFTREEMEANSWQESKLVRIKGTRGKYRSALSPGEEFAALKSDEIKI